MTREHHDDLIHSRKARNTIMRSTLAMILRENVGYLVDTEWTYTASLLTKAADELDRLSARVAELERRLQQDGVAASRSEVP
jgi:hypothetical protein